MTERERWIVYPLLFLALGSALRDKIAKQTQTKEIVCERLFLVDSEGQSVAALIGDTSQLGPRDAQLLGNMRRTNSQLAIGGVFANVVDSEAIFSLNKPIRPTGGGTPTIRSLGELYQYLQKMGAVSPQQAPLTPAPGGSAVEPTNPPSALTPVPPAEGPETPSSPQTAPPAELQAQP